MGEDLKAQHVDRNVALAEIGDDAFRAVVERGGHDDNLVALVERIFVEGLPEAAAELLSQALARCEAPVDRGDVLGAESLYP